MSELIVRIGTGTGTGFPICLGPGTFEGTSINTEPSLSIAHTYLSFPEPPLYLNQILPSFAINKLPDFIISPDS